MESNLCSAINEELEDYTELGLIDKSDKEILGFLISQEDFKNFPEDALRKYFACLKLFMLSLNSKKDLIKSLNDVLAVKLRLIACEVMKIEVEKKKHEINNIIKKRMTDYDMTREEAGSWTIDKGTPEEFKKIFRENSQKEK